MTFEELCQVLDVKTVSHDTAVFNLASEAEAFADLARDYGIRIYCDFIRDLNTKFYYVYERKY